MQLTVLLVALAALGVQGFMPSSSSRGSMRGSTIVMDGKTRDLRDRIKSIKQTRRITEAMRLVAAARVRRAQDAVLKSRPLIAQLQLVYKTVLEACNQEDIQLPILDVREVKKVSLVLVTGDRGSSRYFWSPWRPLGSRDSCPAARVGARCAAAQL